MTRSAAERKAKRYEIAQEVLADGPLYVELDARKPGVVVPPGYDKAGRLVLVIGHDLPPPVRVPWDAVYGFQDKGDDLWRWIEDIPADVRCPESEPSGDAA